MGKRRLEPSTCLFPVPAVLVSCCEPDGASPNIITLAWAGTLSSDPPLVGIAIRPSRFSHGLIERTRDFVVNVPAAAHAKAVDQCGLVSGRDVDKFAACGFTPGKACTVTAPVIAECPVNIECKLARVITDYSKTHHLFLGEITCVDVDDAFASIDPGKMDPLAFCNGEYWSLGRKLGTMGFSKRD